MWQAGKGGRQQAGRLKAEEVLAGLRQLKAGLTAEELEKLVNSLAFEGETISWQEFQKTVQEGANKMESERSFKMMQIQSFINSMK